LPKTAEILDTVVLVFQDTNMLSLAAAVDPMRAANRQSGQTLFNWQFATPEARDVRLTSGLVLPAAPLQRVETCDLLLVVAGFDLEVQSTPAVQASLRRLAHAGTVVAGIDGGPWIMGDAGLLDQYPATTHWEDLEKFSSRFPEVQTQNARFVASGPRWTSGGAVPAIDMMLHLIAERHGAALADKVAGSFIYDSFAPPTRPQSRQVPRLPHTPLTARAQRIMTAHLEEPMPIKALAMNLGISARALQVQFKRVLGVSPQKHYLTLRLQEADRRVAQSNDALQDIALATGFASQSSFARAYRSHFGMAARQRRSRQ
jgi:transcriptional regulator GlxA family with amidase domain